MANLNPTFLEFCNKLTSSYLGNSWRIWEDSLAKAFKISPVTIDKVYYRITCSSNIVKNRCECMFVSFSLVPYCCVVILYETVDCDLAAYPKWGYGQLAMDG